MQDDAYKQYFVPGYLISRNIICSHIQFFLGPYASVRPYSYQGREGYLVTTPGQPLTEVRICQLYEIRQEWPDIEVFLQNQIEDLQTLSRQYEQQASQRMVASGSSSRSGHIFINRPVQVQNRRRYPPGSHGSSRYT